MLEQKRKFINQFETVRNGKQAEGSHIPAPHKRCKALPDGCRKLLQRVQPQLPSNVGPLFQTLKVRRSQNTEGFSDAYLCQRILQTLCVWSFRGQETPLNHCSLRPNPLLRDSAAPWRYRGKVWGSTLGLLFSKCHMWNPPPAGPTTHLNNRTSAALFNVLRVQAQLCTPATKT